MRYTKKYPTLLFISSKLKIDILRLKMGRVKCIGSTPTLDQIRGGGGWKSALRAIILGPARRTVTFISYP